MRRAKVVQGQTWDQSCNQHDGGGEGGGRKRGKYKDDVIRIDPKIT